MWALSLISEVHLSEVLSEGLSEAAEAEYERLTQRGVLRGER
jgi:hypothetical protein